jgi:F-type H+-transporting ATPase subunit b
MCVMRCGVFGLVVLAAVVGLLFVPASFAAEEKHESPHAAGAPPAGQAAADGHGDGEHKDDPFAGWLDLTIWTILVFLLLLFVLGKYAWTPMLEGLEKREHAIHSAAEEAQKARDEAQRLRDEVQAERNRINDERRQTLDEARKNGERVAEQLLGEARKTIQSDRERLNRDLQAERNQTQQQLINQTADLAILISSKVIGRQLSADDHHRLVDEALEELRQAAAQRQQMVANVQ